MDLETCTLVSLPFRLTLQSAAQAGSLITRSSESGVSISSFKVTLFCHGRSESISILMG